MRPRVMLKKILSDKGEFVYKPDIAAPLNIVKQKKGVVMYVSNAGSFYVVGGDTLYYGGDSKTQAQSFFRELARAASVL